MGITCPNKKLKEFKDLVKMHGENISYSLWNEYEGNVPERFYKEPVIEYSLPSQQLSKKLQEFLDNLNFTVEFKEDLLHEYNPISLTDLLYKTILIKQDYKLEGLLKESAYVAYSFLGKKNKIRTDLVRSIENIQNYQTIFEEYKQKNPNLNDYKIKELIVIDFIADAIKNEFKTPRDSYQNRKADYWQIQGNSKLEKQIKYYLGKIKQFIENLFADTRLNREDLNALIADIANDIINQNFDKFGTLLSEEQQLTNYEKTIERDKKADEIVKNFQNLGLLLTGSLALRRQGTLYRSVDEELHDLDFSATKELHGEYFNNLVIELAKNMEGASEQGSYFLKEAFAKKLDKEYLKHPILNKIKELYPTFKVTNTFLSTTEKNELTISGDIDGYAIDLFFVNPEKLDDNEKGFQDWQPIFEAKIKMGRAKDIRDFANYIPFNKKLNTKFGEIKGFRHFNFGNKIKNNTDKFPSANQVKRFGEVLYQKQTASNEGQVFDKILQQNNTELKQFREMSNRLLQKISNKYKVNIEVAELKENTVGDYSKETNSIRLNEKYLTPENLVHEMAHPFVTRLHAHNRKGFYELFNKAVKQYPELHDALYEIGSYSKNIDYLQEELIVRAIEKEYREGDFEKATSIWNKFKKLIQDLLPFFKTINPDTTFRELLEVILASEVIASTVEENDLLFNKRVELELSKYTGFREIFENKIKDAQKQIKDLKENYDSYLGKEIPEPSAPEYLNDLTVTVTSEMLDNKIKNLEQIVRDNKFEIYELEDAIEITKQRIQEQKIYYKEYIEDAQGDVYSIKERPDLYEAFELLDGNKIRSYSSAEEARKRLKGIKKSAKFYDFVARKSGSDMKYRIFVKKPTDYNVTPIQIAEEAYIPLAEDFAQTDVSNEALMNNNSEMFQLATGKRTEVVQELDDTLKLILDKVNIKVKGYEDIKTKFGLDAYGFTKLLGGSSMIGIAALRDKFTLSEEAGHIFFEMLTGTPFYDRIMRELDRNDYYKTILEKDESWEQYNKEYKGNKDLLKREAAGKLLGKTLATKIETISEQPTGMRALLARIRDFLQKLIDRFPYTRIEAKMAYLMGEIADKAIEGKMKDIGGAVTNIPKTGQIMLQTDSSIKGQRESAEKALSAVIKRQQYYKQKNDKKELEKYQNKEIELKNIIDEAKYLEGISFYLKSLKEEQAEFENNLDLSVETLSKVEKFTSKKITNYAGSINRMKFLIDNNLSTLDAIIKELSDQSRHDKELKKELKEILKDSKKLYLKFQEAERIYYDLSTIVVASFLEPIIGDRNSQDVLDSINLNRPEHKKLKYLDIKEALRSNEGDISMVSRWMDALADTNDDILKLLDIAVKNQKIKGDIESLNDQKDLITLQENLNKGGVSSTSFIAETYNGKATGNIVTEYDWAGFEQAEREFYTELKKEFGVNSVNELADDKEIERYNKALDKFYSAYILSTFTPTRAGITYASEAQEFLFQKQKEMSKEEYALWAFYNTKTRSDGKVVVLRNKSKQYQAIQSNKVQKEYYDSIAKMLFELNMLLPEKMRHPRRLPQIKKDWVERIKSAITSGKKEDIVNIFGEVKELFTVAEDADDRGVKYALSNDGTKQVKFLPIYYVNKLQDVSELSLDITSTMAIFSTMARDYAAMNEIVDVMEMARDLIETREVFQVDDQGRPVVENMKGVKATLSRKLLNPRRSSFAADRLAGYMDMVMYGELKKDEGTLGVIVDSFTKYSALTALGFNLFAGIANINTGLAQMHHESAANQFFGAKSTAYADKTYWSNIGGILDGIGSLDSKGKLTGKVAKINLWLEDMQVQQDRKGDAKGLNAERKTMFGRMFNTSYIFFINNAGEHYIQTRTSLALSNNYRYDADQEKFVWRDKFFKEVSDLDLQRRQEIKNMLSYKEINELKEKLQNKKLSAQEKNEIKNRIKQIAPSASAIKAETTRINRKYKELSDKKSKALEAKWEKMTNYYDAHEGKGNKLVMKEGFKYNLADKQKFILRTNALNKEFHGIYNDIDKNELQRYTLFRIGWQFRKWMVPYWNRRYGKGMYNFEKDAYQEGYHTTAFRFFRGILQEAKIGEFSLRKNWNTLSPQEKTNFYRAMSEVGYVLGFIGLSMLVAGADDDDHWLIQMLAYQIKRAITELASMLFPWIFTEGLRMISRPVAATSQIKNLSLLLAPHEWFEEIERGSFKGYNKLERMIIRGTPVLNQVRGWAYPEEKMVFFE